MPKKYEGEEEGNDMQRAVRARLRMINEGLKKGMKGFQRKLEKDWEKRFKKRQRLPYLDHDQNMDSWRKRQWEKSRDNISSKRKKLLMERRKA